MKPTLHQLQVFEKIYDSGGISNAARALHMTQPAVSNLLKQLEAAVGAKLTEVVARKTYLTQAGKIILEASSDVQARLDRAMAEISMLQGNVVGKLSVAGVSTAKYFIPHLLSAFKKHYAKIEIELNIKNREEIIQRLSHNLDDFVIMSQPPTESGISKLDFYEDQLVIVAPSTHPLCKRKKLTLKDLENEAWMIREQGSGTRMAMLRILKQYKVKPATFIQIDNNESIKQATIAGLGISMISQNSVELELATNMLQILHVEHFPLPYKWYLVKQRSKQLSTVAQRFYDFVVNHQAVGHLTQKTLNPKF